LVIGPYPLDIEPPPRGADLKISRSTLGPGIERYHWTKAGRPLTKIDVDLINIGEGAIYAYGEITYKDVFNIERFTRYRMMYGGGWAARDGVFTICEDGNEAN